MKAGKCSPSYHNKYPVKFQVTIQISQRNENTSEGEFSQYTRDNLKEALRV